MIFFKTIVDGCNSCHSFLFLCFLKFSFFSSQDENGEFQIPVDAELETKQNIVIYDEKTSNLLASGTETFLFLYL